MLTRSLARRATAEALGTAFLLAAIVGSGIAASRLSSGDPGLQLLENALATGAALAAIIAALRPVSGAHLNPVVTLVERSLGGISSRVAAVYCAAQVVGAVGGVVVANLMFDLDAVAWSTRERGGIGQGVGEMVAVLGLLLIVFGTARTKRSSIAPFAVGAYIGAAYFFTSSTGFANPAVTLARTLTDTFAGIEPASAPLYLGAQLLAAALAVPVIKLLYPHVADAGTGLVIAPLGGEVAV